MVSYLPALLLISPFPKCHKVLSDGVPRHCTQSCDTEKLVGQAQQDRHTSPVPKDESGRVLPARYLASRLLRPPDTHLKVIVGARQPWLPQIFTESYAKRFRHFLKMTQDLLLPWVHMLWCRFRLGQPCLQSAERPSSTRLAGITQTMRELSDPLNSLLQPLIFWRTPHQHRQADQKLLQNRLGSPLHTA